MKCAWSQLLGILPMWMRQEVDRHGRNGLQELRLRNGLPPELICCSKTVTLGENIEPKDISFIINTASQYSPWAAQTMAQGYITAPGGHRIGICGEAIVKEGKMEGIRHPVSVCIRIARDITGLIRNAERLVGSVLIIGPPGSGKTTLLRELIRLRSKQGAGSVGVVDERGEIFPPVADFDRGCSTDVLTGCSKAEGLEIILRTMGPGVIAVDEITSDKDCRALIRGAWCGVSLLATAHAASKEDLFSRPVYKPLLMGGIFDTVIILQRDKSWKAERMTL